MATFTYTPDFGANKKLMPRIKSINFGDGYEQRYNDGLNTNPQTWMLSFSNRTDIEAEAIDDFLAASKEWSKSLDSYNRNTIQATFIQVFEA